MAGYLINDSYSDWLDSPISTTISTHPIDDLDFPTVTVCPHKGSHTALNHDLMKADNRSLTEKDREDLKQAVFITIIEPSHQDYIKSMVATANPSNLRQMYKGFQSPPKPDKDKGLEIRMWNYQGKFQTPFYKEQYDEEFYKKKQLIKAVLEYPKDIKELVGSGSLIIHLEVDTRVEEGWQEEVQVKGIHSSMKYKLFTEEKTWADAEALCQGEGGHLASVLNEEEWQEVGDVAGNQWSVWLGGREIDTEKLWMWSYGSAWNYSNVAVLNGIRGDQNICVGISKNRHKPQWEWDKEDCKELRAFICQYFPPLLRGNVSLTLKFKKNQLSEPFQVVYSYQASSQELLDSWEDKRMTGFQMNWRIENKNPPLAMTTSQLGRSVQTHSFKRDNMNEDFFLGDQVYTITLLLPSAEQVGSGSLVIQLEVDTNDKEGWQEEVRYREGSKYKLYTDWKSWTDAEAHCQAEGGHLASVHTEDDNKEVRDVAGEEWAVWLGGRRQDESQVWEWSDGSPWGYTNWADIVKHGFFYNCVFMNDKGLLRDDHCTTFSSSFVCKVDYRSEMINKNMALEYNKDNLTISMFKVKYVYKVSTNIFPNSTNNQSTNGIRLSWFLQDKNRSRLTEKMPDLSRDWKPKVKTPSNQDQYLIRMVKLASRARANNTTNGEIFDKIMREKTQLIVTGFIKYTIHCSGGQVKKEFYPKMLAELSVQINNDNTHINVTDEDSETGFMLFSAVVYCSEPVALSQFLHSLLSTQSPRTIIQATVNTIQSDATIERKTKKLLGDFYHSLDKIFHFQLGKILLALTSSSQLETMLAKEWPYFSAYSKQIKECKTNERCKGIMDLTQSVDKG